MTGGGEMGFWSSCCLVCNIFYKATGSEDILPQCMRYVWLEDLMDLARATNG